MNIDAARATLLEHDTALQEDRFLANDMEILPDRLRIGNEQLALSLAAQERICRQVSAPSSYLLGIDAEMRSAVLQWHLSRGDLGSGPVSVIRRGGECVGITRSDLCRLAATDVFDAVMEGVGNVDLSVNKLAVSNGDLLELELTSPSRSTEVARGDILQAGLRVTHSLIGDQATWIESFVLRLVCSNGMTHRECPGKGTTRTRRLPATHQDASRLQIDQVRRLAADTFASLASRLGTIAGLQNEEVDPEGLFRSWLRRARLSDRRLAPLLREAWQQEGGRPTAFDAMNALTRVATHHSSLPTRQRRALAGLAGVLAFRRHHFCPRCFSLLGQRTQVESEGDGAAASGGENNAHGLN